ncbi:MAG: FAD-dependent oxidoreductase [Pseudomonadota bacterium]
MQHTKTSSCFDYIVIGDGILALTSAYRLLRYTETAKIAVIGSAYEMASSASGAMLGVFGELTAGRLKHREHRLYFEMARDASNIWPDFVDELNATLSTEDKIKIGDNGTFVVLNTQGTSKVDTPNYEAILQALKSYHEPHEEARPEDIPGFSPEETCRAVKAVYIPNERFVNPNKVLAGLKKVLENSKRVTMIKGTVNNILTKKSASIKGVTLTTGEVYEADQVIIAAGVGTQSLVDALPVLKGRIPYILAGSGVSFLVDQHVPDLRPIEHVIRTPNRAGACGVHLLPRSDNPDYLYLGAGNMMEWGNTHGASLESASWILTSILKQFSTHLGDARLIRFFSGSRPFSIDGLPVFGASKTVSGLWFLSGTGRDGFHCSPLLSLYMANQLLNHTSLTAYQEKATQLFHTFSPERALIQTCTQQQSIADIKKQVYSVLHETGGLLTTRLDVPFPDWIERDISEIYTRLETDYALPSLVMLPILCKRWKIEAIKAFLDDTKRCYK